MGGCGCGFDNFDVEAELEGLGSQIRSSRSPPGVLTKVRSMRDGSGWNFGSCCVHLSVKRVANESMKYMLCCTCRL